MSGALRLFVLQMLLPSVSLGVFDWRGYAWQARCILQLAVPVQLHRLPLIDRTLIHSNRLLQG